MGPFFALQHSVQNGPTGGKSRATKSRRNFTQRILPILLIGLKTLVFMRFVLFGCIWDCLVALLGAKQAARQNFSQQTQPDESTTPSDMSIDYKVSSFQINLSSGFENKLLTNDLIIVRNHGDDEEDVGEEFGGVVDQQG